MKSAKQQIGILGAFVGLGIGLFLGTSILSQPNVSSAQDRKKQPFHSRYRVVSTEGTNLIVTDYKTQTVYYYAIDELAEPGADLKLRGTIDLRDVGKKVIKPKLYKLNQGG
ncbi:MAG: hypothetical protein ACFCD0_14815 [Gemmataceae bacterium]